MSWSTNRKFAYASTLVIIIAIIVLVPFLFYLYKPPTCTDGIQNGGEQGVDCGGSCQKLCSSAFIVPVIAWTRFERVADGLYNVAAYVINQNVDGEAFGVPYKVQLYDSRGVLITEFNNTLTLPPHRNSLSFTGAVKVGSRIPAKALFEFTGTPNWHKKQDFLSNISILDKKYEENENGSTLTVTLHNNSSDDIGKMSVYAILYDKDSNAIGFSKTILDGISADTDATAPFTWPTNHGEKVISIEVLPVAEY